MSDKTQIRFKGLVLPLLTAMALACASTAHGQTQAPPAAADSEPAPSKPADRERLTQLVKQALPSWDEKVLQAPKTENWAADLTPRRVAEALEDSDLLAVIKEAPNGVEIFRTKGSVLRFDAEKGQLRYVNRARSVDATGDLGKLPENAKAEEIALGTLTSLGLPRREFVDFSVATQIAGGAPVDSREMQVKAEIYRLVTVPRRVGDLPVFVSRARAAVTPEGQIQRLRVNWPPLTLQPDMRLVEADDVVARAVDLLMDHNASEKVQLRAQLGYLPTDAKDETVVMPVVLFSVEDPPTPFMFSVPVVEPGEGDDDAK